VQFNLDKEKKEFGLHTTTRKVLQAETVRENGFAHLQRKIR